MIDDREQLLSLVNSCQNKIRKLQQENERLKAIEKDHQKLNGELREENKELRGKIEALKELDLYESEADYDYEENLSLNYVPFDIEEFLKGDK